MKLTPKCYAEGLALVKSASKLFINLGVEVKLLEDKDRDRSNAMRQSEAFAKASSSRMKLKSWSSIYSKLFLGM